MKRLFLSWITLLLAYTGFSQNHIQEHRIAVGYNYTTNLIFPFRIIGVDIGGEGIIGQRAMAAENILQVKASSKNFETTSLSVLTSDGHFYSFIVNYADSIGILNYDYASDSGVLLKEAVNETELLKEYYTVLGEHQHICMRVRRDLLQLSLEGLYVTKDRIWCRLAFKNLSSLSFEPALVRFFLKDSKRLKRSALQELNIEPIFMPISKGDSKWVYGFPLFSIPHHQRLCIQISDQKGSRMVEIKISHRLLLAAKKL
ncbi:MAG: DUF4138 domain-containing protein [Agriterribacter sp.]